MRYGIGLDIGVASVGSAIVLLDEKGEPYKIYRLSSRVFPKAETEKGESLASDRRIKRGMRRRLRRRHHRKERIRNLIYDVFNVNEDYITEIYAESGLKDIYQIRYEALDRKLDKDEFIRLLIHLSQRRGFKSNRKSDVGKKDDGKLLDAVKKNAELRQKMYRTIGEMLYCDDRFADGKRNTGSDYKNTFSRSEYGEEIKHIFKNQRTFGNEYATEDFEDKFTEIIMSQRSFDEGPGKGSKYSGNLIERLVGKCTFEREEMRAPKASYTFEYFNLLSKINAIKIVSANNTRCLTEEERTIVKNLAFSQKDLSYKSLRKALGLNDDELFNISYANSDTSKRKGKKNTANTYSERDDVEDKTKFTYLKAYHTFKKAYGDEYDSWDTDKKDYLGYVLTVFKTDTNVELKLQDRNFSVDEISVAQSIPSFSKWGNLSIKAMKRMIPYLEKGEIYNRAAEMAGYNFKADDKCSGMYLPANESKAPELGDIVNPVVRRSVSQTIKVINAIVREMGESPVYVNIELARDLAKSHAERDKIEKMNDANRRKNDEIMEELRKEFTLANPKGEDLIKLKLWNEQNGRCMYSGEPLVRERLFEPGYAEIDHIIPYSISFDDRMSNKVLVKAKENRDKGNRLPLQYMTGKKADDFRVRVSNSILSRKKKNNLLKEQLTEEDRKSFKQRNLQDTQYISRFMMNFIKKYLKFAGEAKIVAVNGRATDYMRKRWGIRKIRADGDTHHAVDACVVACATHGMVQRISEYSKYKETEYIDDDGRIYDINKKTGELTDRFPMPYPMFRKELEMLTSNDPQRILSQSKFPNYSGDEQLEPIFVSRMPQHKVTGAAHEDTLRKPVTEDGQNYVVQKVKLTKLKLNNGEIENYYMPQSDKLLYNALKERLAEYGGDGEKAFKNLTEPFRKPKSDGTPGPIVTKVKTIEKQTCGVPLADNTTIADNGPMVRVDVFYVSGEGYYLVPIYVSDTVKKELPNRAILQNKPYSEWKVMDDKNFLFSLYNNDLVKITFKREKKFSLVNKDSTLDKEHRTKSELLYYKGTDISTASIKVINHDNTYFIRGLGVKTLISMEKYEVDVLGRVRKVNKEKRMGF